MRVERDGDDICLAFLLKQELFERGPNQRFEGEVSGVIGAGAFIRFTGEKSDTYEGFLPVRKLRDDHYDLNDTDSALVGARTGRRLGFGDRVEIKVDSIEAARGSRRPAPWRGRAAPRAGPGRRQGGAARAPRAVAAASRRRRARGPGGGKPEERQGAEGRGGQGSEARQGQALHEEGQGQGQAFEEGQGQGRRQRPVRRPAGGGRARSGEGRGGRRVRRRSKRAARASPGSGGGGKQGAAAPAKSSRRSSEGQDSGKRRPRDGSGS